MILAQFCQPSLRISTLGVHTIDGKEPSVNGAKYDSIYRFVVVIYCYSFATRVFTTTQHFIHTLACYVLFEVPQGAAEPEGHA